MDIEQARSFALNKIKTDSLAQYVRDEIKNSELKKQKYWEIFKEAYQPLLLSQESIKKSIDQQQNSVIAKLQANQDAITNAIRDNRRAVNVIRDDLDDEAIEDEFERIRANQDRLIDRLDEIREMQVNLTDHVPGDGTLLNNIQQSFRRYEDALRDFQRAFKLYSDNIQISNQDLITGNQRSLMMLSVN